MKIMVTSPLAGTATPALSGCPRQQGRWAGEALQWAFRELNYGSHGGALRRIPIGDEHHGFHGVAVRYR
jgi:hypothetical protein